MKHQKAVEKHLRKWTTARALAKALGVTVACAGRYIAKAIAEAPVYDSKEVREGLRGPPSKAYRIPRG